MPVSYCSAIVVAITQAITFASVTLKSRDYDCQSHYDCWCYSLAMTFTDLTIVAVNATLFVSDPYNGLIGNPSTWRIMGLSK